MSTTGKLKSSSSELDLGRPNIEDYLPSGSTIQQEPHGKLCLRDLLNISPTLSEAAGAIVDDSFTRCFKSNPPEPWNWNIYLFPLWCFGVLVRYLILFPARVLVLTIGWIIFLSSFIPVHFLLKGNDKLRRKMERFLVEMMCGFFVASWTGVVKYHGPRPSIRPKQVFGKFIKTNIEPIIDLLMNNMIFVTNLFRGAFLFHGFSLGCCSILISPTDVNGIVTTDSAISSKDISTQHASNYIAEMRNIVDIRQGTGNEDVALARNRKLPGFWVVHVASHLKLNSQIRQVRSGNPTVPSAAWKGIRRQSLTDQLPVKRSEEINDQLGKCSASQRQNQRTISFPTAKPAENDDHIQQQIRRDRPHPATDQRRSTTNLLRLHLA